MDVFLLLPQINLNLGEAGRGAIRVLVLLYREGFMLLPQMLACR
jgi:hypothetical protein